MADIVLYTEGFPFNDAETFLESEILYLCQFFDTIHIIPLKGSGSQRPVPSNVKVYPPVTGSSKSLLLIYAYGLFYSHLIFSDQNLKSGLTKNSLRSGIKYLGYAIFIKKNIEKNLPKDVSVHYSYWLNYNAFALSLLKKQGKIKILISRAHGFDLYEERGEKSLNFIKSSTISRIDKLFFVSLHGLNYLKAKYPDFSSKFTLSRLGTPEPGFLNPQNKQDNLVIVSCSMVRAVKRVYLIMEALKNLSLSYPPVSIIWYHLGGGAGLSQLLSDATNLLADSNIKYFLSGNRTNKEIFDFYRNQSVDVFINTSESEGLPVTIMEAQSFGIPAIATAVGGTPEIVNFENGFLLPANPSADEIAAILYDVYSNKEKWNIKRVLSRKNWGKNFNAEKNYKAFAEELLSLAETK